MKRLLLLYGARKIVGLAVLAVAVYYYGFSL